MQLYAVAQGVRIVGLGKVALVHGKAGLHLAHQHGLRLCGSLLGGHCLRIDHLQIGQVLGFDIAFLRSGAHLAPHLAVLDHIHQAVARNAVAAVGVVRGRAAHLEHHRCLADVRNAVHILLRIIRKGKQRQHQHGQKQRDQTFHFLHGFLPFRMPAKMRIHGYYTCICLKKQENHPFLSNTPIGRKYCRKLDFLRQWVYSEW